MRRCALRGSARVGRRGRYRGRLSLPVDVAALSSRGAVCAMHGVVLAEDELLPCLGRAVGGWRSGGV